jgi:hypothetical protein
MTGGVHLSAGREERSKAAWLEASSCGGGGNSAGGVFLWERGSSRLERKKRMGRGWAERPDGPEVMGKILFQIKFNF